MKVTIAQLATYIERDGWHLHQPATVVPGHTSYEAPNGYHRVDVPDNQVPELDRERDAAYASVAARRRKEALR